jgi:hypothetical protein
MSRVDAAVDDIHVNAISSVIVAIGRIEGERTLIDAVESPRSGGFPIPLKLDLLVFFDIVYFWLLRETLRLFFSHSCCEPAHGVAIPVQKPGLMHADH